MSKNFAIGADYDYKILESEVQIGTTFGPVGLIYVSVVETGKNDNDHYRFAVAHLKPESARKLRDALSEVIDAAEAEGQMHEALGVAANG